MVLILCLAFFCGATLPPLTGFLFVLWSIPAAALIISLLVRRSPLRGGALLVALLALIAPLLPLLSLATYKLQGGFAYPEAWADFWVFVGLFGLPEAALLVPASALASPTRTQSA